MKTLTNKWIVVMVVWSLLMLLPPSPGLACECITSGETKLARMQFPGETHCYVFWGETGQGTVIQIADDDSSWPPRIQLYDPNGARVAEAVDGSYPYTYSAIENYRLEMEGVYTIVVSYGGGTNEYGLSLALTGGSMTSPGDADGGDVSPSAARSGTIAPLGDTDIYVFRGHMGQGIVIEMADNDSSWPPRVQLYDPYGVRVAEAVDGSYPYTYAAIENHQLKATGIYTVVASYGGGVGAYGLSVAVMPPKEPRGLYPCEPQPADGQVIDYCDPNTAFSDVLVENLVLPGGTVVTRHSSPYLLSWWSVLGATGYDVYFSGGPCLPLEKIGENVADPWIPMPRVEDEQVCSWRVVAHTPAGDIQGPTWWFMACCVPPPPDGCTLTVKVVGQGSIEGATEGLNEYPCGEIVSIKAKPDPGYEFVRWQGSATDGMEDPTATEITVIVDDDDTLTAVFEEILYEVTMDEDPDWTLEGQWEYGTPTGQRCGAWGNNDPTSGCTGPNVIAVNLNGCYDQTIGGPYYATTRAIDVSGYEDVRLRFCRWLNCDIPEYVRCTVEVSTDNATWNVVWTQAEREEITDTEWTLCEYPLAQADSQPTVYLRWGYHVLKERAYAYTGWNLDDVQLIGRRQ